MAGIPAPVLRAVGPGKWPSLPTEMTVTTLREVEACPRRWALSAASYPEIWDRPGYPPKIQLPRLAGSVVHLALETVTKQLARAGCRSVHDAGAITVMRELGGYTPIASDCVRRVLEPYEGNPRAAPVLDTARRALESQIPELRTRIQSLLCRVQLRVATGDPEVRDSTLQPRRPLGPGAHTEVTLRAHDLGWVGRADLMTLSESECEIRDFKTGEESDEHPFQLRVYALLWWRDGELNPTARPADSLILSYQSGDVRVEPPTLADLEALERDILDRTGVAKSYVDANPPEARPGIETCRYCSVRHLCDDYWRPETQRRLAKEAQAIERFGDLELSIEGRHGPSSWDARVEVSRVAPVGRRLVLRTTSSETNLHVGDRVRVLDVRLVTATEDEGDDAGKRELSVATMSVVSEAFIVPEKTR